MSITELERIAAVETHLVHLRQDLRDMRKALESFRNEIKGLMWKVVSIGTGSGALGFVVALYANRMVGSG